MWSLLFPRQAGGSAACSSADDGAEVIGDIFAEPEGEAPEPPPGERTPAAPPPVPVVTFGGASSSGDCPRHRVVEPMPPPPAPPAPASRAPSARAASHADSVRGSAEVVVHFPSCGKISFYAGDNRFEAVCSCHTPTGSSRCILTRTSAGSNRKKSQGRPLGLLAAWLLNAEVMGTKDDHCNRLWLLSSLSKEDRLAARRYLASLPAGPNLLACERAKAQNEDSEPDGVP